MKKEFVDFYFVLFRLLMVILWILKQSLCFLKEDYYSCLILSLFVNRIIHFVSSYHVYIISTL